MERKSGFEHTFTKKMNAIKYIEKDYPKEYMIVSYKFVPLNQVEVTFTNLVPVIVGINPNNFGLPETRKTIKKPGTYYNMNYAAKGTKKLPHVPSWAVLTGNVIPLDEWRDGYEYTNKDNIILTEKFSLETEQYEFQNIEVKEIKSLQRKRTR